MRRRFLGWLLLVGGCHALLPLGGPPESAPPPDQAADLAVDLHPEGPRADAPQTPSDLGTPWRVKTIAGSGLPGFQDGDAASALFYRPHDVTVDPGGTIYVADTNNHCIRSITGTQVDTFAGTCAISGASDGNGQSARFNHPVSVTLDPTGQWLYIAEYDGNRIRRLQLSSRQVTTVAGIGLGTADGDALTEAQFQYPNDVAVVASGGTQVLYVTDNGGQRLRQIQDGQVDTLAGDGSVAVTNGPFSQATFKAPHMMVPDAQGRLYLTSFEGHCVRLIDPGAQTVSSVAGVADVPGYQNGHANAAIFDSPAGLALDPSGRYLFVSEAGNHRIRVVDLAQQQVGTLAGSGTAGSWDDVGLAAQLNQPEGLFFHQGKLYVADYQGHQIRVLEP